MVKVLRGGVRGGKGTMGWLLQLWMTDRMRTLLSVMSTCSMLSLLKSKAAPASPESCLAPASLSSALSTAWTDACCGVDVVDSSSSDSSLAPPQQANMAAS